MTATMKPDTEFKADAAADATERPERRLLVGYLHKTSNTLCGIKGYASLIADRDAGPGEAGAWARKIIAEVERMEEIFRSVGDLTRGRSHPDLGVDLPVLVHDLARQHAAGRPGLVVRCESVPEGELLIPAADLGLVLGEVLDNCADSGPRAIRVRIRGGRNARGRVVLTVQDDGAGMEPELVSQAALPFVTTREGHIGVGLTRVDTLMEMYGLEWQLTSGPGRGTTVSLEIAEVC